MNISDYLNKIQDLTNKNLKILQTINQAFLSNKNHISVHIDDATYVIPSFIALEDKLSSLEHIITDIFNITKTGEAAIDYGGNTQLLHTTGYMNYPAPASISSVSEFFSQPNHIFKDFLTPNVYVKFDLSGLANNIKTASIKKVTLKNSALVASVGTGLITYGDLKQKLFNYAEGTDYIEYDTIKRLPVREGAAYGDYDIVTIDSHWTDDDFVEHYKFKIDSPLTYLTDSGSVTNNMRVGDELITNNGQVRMIIEDLWTTTQTLQVSILNGSYAELGTTGSNNPDLYHIRYYRSIDWNNNKYLDVLLEEDQYVCIFIAPIDDTTNTQAPWTNGVSIDTDTLVINDNGTMRSFRDYYNVNVNNVGDSLFAITSMFDTGINNLTPAEFNALINFKPATSDATYTVTQINKHLDDTETVQNIRRLYKQKAQFEQELKVKEESISTFILKQAKVNFSDTVAARSKYSPSIDKLNKDKTQLISNINAVIRDISNQVNKSTVPVENAKYRIRGFVIPTVTDVRVIKVDVQYRYKSLDSFTGNAETIGGTNIFSDWNILDSKYLQKIPTLDGNSFKFRYEDSNEDKNLPSYNQIDIPISQGEVVDVRFRYVYDYCHPFGICRGSWSDILTVSFPDEFKEDVTILDIIKENNDDVKRLALENELSVRGVTDHISRKVNDQDIVYLHDAANITSGFYTAERRVIPLNNKIKAMDDDIVELKSEVYGSSSENLIVSIVDGEQQVQLNPYVNNYFFVDSYADSTNHIKIYDQGATHTKMAYAQPTIQIYNAGKYNMHLYSMFPGNLYTPITTSTRSKFVVADFINSAGQGPLMYFNDQSQNPMNYRQRLNQWIYFRIKDIYSGNQFATYEAWTANTIPFFSNINKTFLEVGDEGTTDKTIVENWPLHSGSATDRDVPTGAFLSFVADEPDQYNGHSHCYPFPGQLSSILVDDKTNCLTLKPGESIVVPLSYWYAWSSNTGLDQSEFLTVSSRISFDIRPSLYTDPINYTVDINADYSAKSSHKTRRAQADAVNTPNNYNTIIVSGNVKVGGR